MKRALPLIFINDDTARLPNGDILKYSCMIEKFFSINNGKHYTEADVVYKAITIKRNDQVIAKRKSIESNWKLLVEN